MATIKVRRLKSIPAEITVPGDKSISHRAVMFAGLAKGRTVISGFLPSEDCICTVHAMEALGAEVEWLEQIEGVGWVKLAITGHGMQLKEPAKVIDCGNSGTTTRLLSGILAGQPFTTTLEGDASLSRRPMKRIADPLSLMGAKVEGQGEKICAPLRITGGNLSSITYHLPVASAQVKSAVLLAGMFAPGKTSVVEPVATRNHTERLMSHFGIKWLRDGDTVSVYGGQTPRAEDIIVPGDISSAAFWMVAVAAVPGSQITINNVGLNTTRTGIIDVLLKMGAKVTDSMTKSDGEPQGNITVKGGELNATVIGGSVIPNVIDELPILAVAAALARGNTLIKDAAELRVKETDRIAAVADNLRRMGVTVTEFDDGMEIEGGAQLKGATIDSYGDHRIAMAFAIAGLHAEGMTTIEGTECISTSYPGFERDLNRFLQASTTEPSIPVLARMPRGMGIETLSAEDAE
ncbi:MAG: 3-phosphoshikimate 1-carboxyvinyltransferase [Verrucomicrobiaceae bacterium]|nr:3-phosphoshikimate 1-carboxyvinyltransferase [Verrucomicrobiaceae bacterium]